MYLDLVMGLNFAVDLLLLIGADKLAGFPVRLGRSAAAAALGGIYGGLCLLPGFRFLGNLLWRTVFLALMAAIAFGLNRSAIRRGVLFVLLSMALGGIALGLGKGGLHLIGAAAGVAALCAIGFRGKTGQRFAAVELYIGNRRKCLTALHDTGNTLADPVTGNQVLVVGSEVGEELLGLTQEQLSDPIGTMAEAVIPGLRLIPYRAVGQPAGMLLAIKPDLVKIGGKTRKVLVAFAPQHLGGNGYEALAGGIA